MTSKQIRKWESHHRYIFNKGLLENWKKKILEQYGFDFNKQQNENFLTFDEARTFVHSLELKTYDDWNKWWRENQPDNIPAHPNRTYKKQWISMYDWLGTNPGWNGIYLPFDEARTFARSLKLERQKDWFNWWKANKPHNNIPFCPDNHYKEWISWGDFLGTGSIACRLRKYLSFKEARKVIHPLKLKSHREWKEYIQSNKLQINIPRAPDLFYKNKGWISWGDWLGTNRICERLREFLSIKEAKIIVHKLNLKSAREYRNWWKINRPNNIPCCPQVIYKGKGWKSMYDWLGNI